MTNIDLSGLLDCDAEALKKQYDAERDRRIRPGGTSLYVGTW
ncbi:MAG: hypothetical protein ACK5MR_15125 [Cumulibacter sp.]